MVFSVLLIAPLVLRRRAPVAVFAVVMLLSGAQLPFAHEFIAANVAALVALYTLVAYAPRRLAAIGFALTLAGAVPYAALFDNPSSSDAFVIWLVLAGQIVLAAALGDRTRARLGERARLEERARLLAAERDQQATIAAAAERARIARELHDVVAHSLSVVIAQADGGRYAAEQDPSQATAALDTIATTAREAQAEMRRALGILREQPGAPFQPQPGVGELPALVARTREAGLAVELTAEGVARDLPPAAAVTLYRVAQEALTERPETRGARRHGLRHAALGARPRHARRARRRRRRRRVRRRSRRRARGDARAGRAPRRHAQRRAPSRRRVRGPRRAADRRRAGSDRNALVIRIFLVDDQSLVRAGLKLVIDSQRDMTVVGEAGDGRAALDALAVTTVDVVLMDVRMPVLDGVETTARLLERDGAAAPRVIVLTTFDLDEYVFAAIRAGAGGFMLKDAEPEELLAAIRAVHSGDAVVAPSATRRLLEQVADRLPGRAAATSGWRR